MKFICDNCKAKYQIGDDKIAGRSVRMKCRRCGHLIQLSASVTAGDAVAAVPHDVVESSVVESNSSASMSLADLLAAHPSDDPFDEGPTRAMTIEQRVAGARAAAAPATAAAPVATALRPAIGGAAPAARPAPGAPVAGLGAQRPGALGAPRLGAAAPAAPTAARPAAAARTLPSAAAPRVPAGGVAGAFQKAVGGAPAVGAPPAAGAGSAGHVPHGEDWYVGVGGVPLGPVRLAVIREKAQAGSVHADSLVWREGFDEWQPLKTFPELLQIVQEAQAARGAAARRPSVVPPPARPGVLPPVKPPSIAPPPPRAPGAPAGYQPKATAIGVGLPAARLPAQAPGAPSPPAAARSTLPAALPPPAAPGGLAPGARPGLGAARPGLGARPGGLGTGLGAKPGGEPPRPIGAPRASQPELPPPSASSPALPPPSGPAPRASSPALPALRASSPALEPLAAAPAASSAAAEEHPLAATAVSPGVKAPSGAAGSAADDLFGLGLGGAAPDAGGAAPAAPAAAVGAAAAGAAAALDASAPEAKPTPLPSAAASTPLPAGALDVMRDPFAAPAPSGSNGAAAGGAALAAGAAAGGAALATGAAAGGAALATGAAAGGAALATGAAAGGAAAAGGDVGAGVLAPPIPAATALPARASADSLPRASVVPAPPAPLSVAEPEDVLPRRRQGLHPLAYALIAMAAAFGGVVAFLLFSKPAQPTIVYVPQPGATAAAPGPGTAEPAGPASAEPTGDVPVASASTGPRPVLTGKGPGPVPSSTASAAPVDTSGFGNQVVPGPAATPSGTGGDPSLGQLSAGEIQGVVAANQARIRKRCWQPALDSAGPNATGNARVQGKIVIGPSGAVQSATASGAERDYPGLSSCIAGQMQGWKFPPSSGSTPVNVPFVFAGQ